MGTRNRRKISFPNHEKETERKIEIIRRRCEVQTVSPSPILCLPKDLMVEILARVAACSRTDFFRSKLSCKRFYELSDDDYIYRHMSLHEYLITFALFKLDNREQSFFDRCFKCGNLDAMYREGVCQCFFEFEDNSPSGLALLERAASGGHLGASYVFGFVLICKGGEYVLRGLEILGNIKTGLQMRECRKALELRSRGLRRYILKDSLKPGMLPCLFPDQIRAAKLYLDAQDDDNNLHCKTCRLNREMLHVWVNLTRWKDPYGCDAAFRVLTEPYAMCALGFHIRCVRS